MDCGVADMRRSGGRAGRFRSDRRPSGRFGGSADYRCERGVDRGNPGGADWDHYRCGRGLCGGGRSHRSGQYHREPHRLQRVDGRRRQGDRQRHDDARFRALVTTNIPGSEYNTGSLGHVIGIGSGICISAKIDNKKYKVFTLIGDGECESGSIWEAIKFASDEKLNNLITIVDMNRLSEMQIMKDDHDLDLKNKFESFGWTGLIVDGHSFEELISNLTLLINNNSNKPKFLIANTIKGKGVSFMENKVEWHHQAPKPEQFEIALKEYE